MKTALSAVAIASVVLMALATSAQADGNGLEVSVFLTDTEPDFPICAALEPCTPLQWLGPLGATSDPAPVPVTFFIDPDGMQTTVIENEITITQINAVASKIHFEPFHFVKRVDKSSPTLFIYDVSGGSVTVEGPGDILVETDRLMNVGESISFAYGVVSGNTLEPSTWAMMALGFAGLGFLGDRKTRSDNALA